MLRFQSQKGDYKILFLQFSNRQIFSTPKLMKVFHIDQFKCTLCSNWFCPPYNLPYMLPCTHSICQNCLTKSKSSTNQKIVCPEDLEVSHVSEARINEITKKALQRLMKQHNNFNENTQLDCIKSLSLSFDEIISKNFRQLNGLTQLIDEIFKNEINRLQTLHCKLKAELARPETITTQWKDTVKTYLCQLKKMQGNGDGYNKLLLNEYIEEGRKIKMELNQYFGRDLNKVANELIKNPSLCMYNHFTIIKKEEIFERTQKIPTINSERFEQQDSQSYILQQNPKTMKKPADLVSGAIFKNKEQQKNNNTISNINQSKLSQNKRKLQENSAVLAVPPKQTDLMQMSSATSRFNELIGETSKRNCSKSIRKLPQKNKSKQSQIKKKVQSNNNSQTIKQNGAIQRRQDNITEAFDHSAIQGTDNNSILDIQTITSVNKTIKSGSQGNREIQKRTLNQIDFINNKITKTINEQIEHEMFEKKAKKNQTIIKSMGNQSFPNINTLYNQQRSGYFLQTENKQNSAPQVIRQLYMQQAGEHQQQELLLSTCNKQGNWSLGHMNFLKEIDLTKQKKQQQLEILQKNQYDCEKQKLNYMKKMQQIKVEQALAQTETKDNFIELINFSLHDVDIALYLSNFDWNQIQIVKFVRTGLSDDQLNSLLNYILNSKVHTLVLSSNNLSDMAIDAFVHFTEYNSTLKNVYLPKNYVNMLKVKGKIQLLKEKQINIYI